MKKFHYYILIYFICIATSLHLKAQQRWNGAILISYDSAQKKWVVGQMGMNPTIYEHKLAAYNNYSDWMPVNYSIYIDAKSVAYDPSLNWVTYFGKSKYIETYTGDSLGYVKGHSMDSINIAQEIKSLVSIGAEPGYAIVENDSLNLLLRKNKGSWDIVPIKIDNLQELNTNRGWGKVLLAICFALLGIIIFCLIYLRKANREIYKYVNGQKADNALRTKSEKPIGLDGQDLLGFEAMEDAVVSIIKNPQTELPMSIVIDGSWGSGKSSMMNRIKERIERLENSEDRFINTWFNAWHLQGESSLLNTFLLSVIGAFERDYTFTFRLRLAIKRFLRLPILKQFSFGFAMAVIVPFLLLVIIKMFPFLNFKQLGFIEEYCTSIKNIFSGTIFKNDFSLQSLKPVAAILFAVISYMFLNKQFMPTGLGAFFELLPKNNFRFEVEKSTPGYREQFKKEYWEIIDAGKKYKRLVVFIDDIDRIGGDKILELLEAINFISDIASKPAGTTSKSSNTIFIMGMSMKQVAKNLGVQLEKTSGSKEIDEAEAIAHGNSYLEKMVQLIVPVPFDKSSTSLNYLYENE